MSILRIRDKNGNFIPIKTLKGENGKSAYEQAQAGGYKGTEEEFVALLNGLTSSEEANHYSDLSNPHKTTAGQVGAHDITDKGTLIPQNSNLNDYTIAGDYYSPASHSSSIVNTPITSSDYRLIVEAGCISGQIRQYAIGPSEYIYTRHYTTSWSQWLKILTDADLQNSIYYHASKLLTNEDLDTIKTVGHYYATGSNTCANSPVGEGRGFGLEVFRTASNYYTQVAYATNKIYIRYYGGSWTGWKQLYTESYKPTPADIGAATEKDIKNLENKAEYSYATILASGWSGSVYSFESSYPHATYDIEIYLNGDNITAEQKTAYDVAEIVGSFNSNTIKGLGDVPTIDIPIIIKAVKK